MSGRANGRELAGREVLNGGRTAGPLYSQPVKTSLQQYLVTIHGLANL